MKTSSATALPTNLDPNLPGLEQFSLPSEKGTPSVERKKQQQMLQAAFIEARNSGSITFSTSAAFDYLISPEGRIRSTCPIPSGGTLEEVCYVGLSKPFKEAKFLECRYSPEDKGFWLHASGLNKHGDSVSRYILFAEDKSGKEAIFEAHSPGQKLMRDSYRSAMKFGTHVFSPPHAAEEIIAKFGAIKNLFLLPDGNLHDEILAIGLPAPSLTPKLHEISYNKQDSAYWCKFSAQNSDGQEVFRYLRVPEVSGPDNKLRGYSTFQKAQHEHYLIAKNSGPISFDPPQPAHDIINEGGSLKNSFLLPCGRILSAAVGIGLPEKTKNPTFHSIAYSPERKGYWIHLSSENIHAVRSHRHILVADALSGESAIVTSLTDTQKFLEDSYLAARGGATVHLLEPRDLSESISSQGPLKNSFLLPCGEILGTGVGIGLPIETRNPRLHEVKFSKEDAGFWLLVSAENEFAVRMFQHVLVSENKSGRDAISESRSLIQKFLRDIYLSAKQGGTITFSEPVDFSEVIGSQGQLKQSFLLPSGGSLGGLTAIGFPKKISSPALVEIGYLPGEKAFALTIEALDTYGRILQSTIHLSETLNGKEAVLYHQVDRENDVLPIQFARETTLVPQNLKKSRNTSEQSPSTQLERKQDPQVTFIKGEAFEQIVGILLASVCPNEKVIPQFCLDVNPDRKFFGVRADYKVGSQIFEVKWGGARENIEATYSLHQQHLKPGDKYALISLQDISHLGLPSTSFSHLALYSPIQKELTEIIEYLEKLVARKDADSIVALRDYLHSAQRREQGTLGDERSGNFAAVLRDLLAIPEEQRKDFLNRNTSVHFSNLEAHFEFKGKLYRSFITPKSLYTENPEQYRKLYGFAGVLFEKQLDRDISVLLECALIAGKARVISEFLPYQREAHQAPTFSLPDGTKISSLGSAGTIMVRSLEDLKAILQFPDDNYSFAIEYIKYHGRMA